MNKFSYLAGLCIERTTEQVLVEHLVCACTGLPRQDMEWILEFGNYTPESSLELLGTIFDAI